MSTEKLFFLPVPEVKVTDLLNWQDPAQRQHRHLVHRMESGLKISMDSRLEGAHNKCFGKYIDLNDSTIALFRIGKEVYATQAKCPHAGGPLYLADIEELVPGRVTLRCPWHKWTFNIDTGKCVTPPNRALNARTYPVRVDDDGKIFIGFESFGPSAFRSSF